MSGWVVWFDCGKECYKVRCFLNSFVCLFFLLLLLDSVLVLSYMPIPLPYESSTSICPFTNRRLETSRSLNDSKLQ